MTLHLRADLLEAVLAHARRDHPDEACGVLAGPAGSNRAERVVPMLNAARSPTFYEFDAGEQLRLYRDLDARDEDVVVVYHSHTATAAVPSRTDVALAAEPDAHYLLVSTREGLAEPEVRSWRIRDGEAVEEPLVVVPVPAPAEPPEPGPAE